MGKKMTAKAAIRQKTGEKYPTAVVGEPQAPVHAAQESAPATVAPTPAAHGVSATVAPTPAAHGTPATPQRDGAGDALTHIDEHGDARMVDVSQKAETQRLAVAEGCILMHPETQAMVLEDRAKKGDVLACARIAGIMAAKRTSDLIPLCHPLMITKSAVDIEAIPASGDGARPDGRVGFRVKATCGVTGVTGIEMEALTAVSCACLTIYDMCKAVDRGMEIVDVHLLRKEGGRSGVWERTEQVDDAMAVDTGNGAEAASPLPGGPGCGPAAPAIAFIGYQNSGKTTLVEKVISRLTRRGLRVGSIKHHGEKNIEVDQPGKDSWRHAQAGSRHVGIVSPGRYAEYADTGAEVPVEDLLAHFTDVDVVVVEGYKTAGLPNIVVSRSGVDRLRGDDSYDLIDDNTVAIACNELVERNFRARATKDAGNDGATRALPPFLSINDAAAIVNFIMTWLGK